MVVSGSTNPRSVISRMICSAAIRGAVNGMMLQVIQGHLTDHVVKEPDETQREADLETVMQVIKSYLK